MVQIVSCMETTNPKPSIPGQNPNRSSTSFARIQELNGIDRSIAQLLQAAGEAIRILGSNSTANNLPSAKSQFLQFVTTYFTTLSSIDVRLRRQVYGLQEAGLIADGDAKDAKRGASAASAGATAAAGAGPVDLSWLNGRGDQVEKDMEREVWMSARKFVQSLVQQVGPHGYVAGNGGTGIGRVEGGDGQEGGRSEENDGV